MCPAPAPSRPTTTAIEARRLVLDDLGATRALGARLASLLRAGDLVRLDADGDMWFVSRMDDMIKTMGFRLSPTEVEDLLSQSGMVTDAVAFGIDDEARGQAVVAAVTLIDGADEAALMAHCRKTMAHYMQPARIHSWPGPMPRTASGKLDRPAVIRVARG